MRFVLLLFICAFTCFGSAIFQDSTLTLGSYTVSQNHSAGVTETISNTAIGNPSNGLLVTDVIAPGPLSATYAFINSSFAYDPNMMGPLSSLSASLDVRGDVAIGQIFASGWDLWIAQGSNFFFHEFGGPGVEGVFQTIGGSGVHAADFTLFNFANGTTNAGAHPNFAQPLTLGFGAAVIGYNFAGPTGTDTVQWYYDNLSINASSVPEPSTFWLLAICISGAAAAGKLRRNIA